MKIYLMRLILQISLKYYNYNTEELINAILEQSLPTELKELKDLGHSQMSASSTCTVRVFYYQIIKIKKN